MQMIEHHSLVLLVNLNLFIQIRAQFSPPPVLRSALYPGCTAWGTSCLNTLAQKTICSREVHALRCAPMFSTPCSSACCERRWAPLGAMCPKRCAVPLVASVAAQDRASSWPPAIFVCTCGCDSVGTVRPLGGVGTSLKGPGKCVASSRT